MSAGTWIAIAGAALAVGSAVAKATWHLARRRYEPADPPRSTPTQPPTPDGWMSPHQQLIHHLTTIRSILREQGEELHRHGHEQERVRETMAALRETMGEISRLLRSIGAVVIRLRESAGSRGRSDDL